MSDIGELTAVQAAEAIAPAAIAAMAIAPAQAAGARPTALRGSP